MSFKFNLIAIFFCFYYNISFGQKAFLDCRVFKTGSFVYKDYPFNTVDVKRTKQKQFETDKATGIKVEYKIKWISDCEYELIQIGSNSDKVRILNNSVINVKIIETDSSSYKYLANQGGVISSYTLVKVK